MYGAYLKRARTGAKHDAMGRMSRLVPAFIRQATSIAEKAG